MGSKKTLLATKLILSSFLNTGDAVSLLLTLIQRLDSWPFKNIKYSHILKQWIAFKARSEGCLTPISLVCYWPLSNSHGLCVWKYCHRCRNNWVKSPFFARLPRCVFYILNNSSSQSLWLAVNIFLAASWVGKFPSLATSSLVGSC